MASGTIRRSALLRKSAGGPMDFLLISFDNLRVFRISTIAPGVPFVPLRRPISESHRYFLLNVGPTVRIASVHRFATSLLPAGPPTSFLDTESDKQNNKRIRHEKVPN